MEHKAFLQHIEHYQPEFMQYILDKAGVGSWVRDNQRDLVRLDKSLIKMWGMQGQWFPGDWVSFSKDILPLVVDFSEQDIELTQKIFSGQLQQDAFVVRHGVLQPSGKKISCEVRVEVHSRDERGVPIVITGLNIETTELLAIKQQAFVDPLTKTSNRKKLHEDYPDTIPLATTGIGRVIAMFDLDNFKGINDSYGHMVGDKVLSEFAKTVTAVLRGDDEIYRFGGDEFVLISGFIPKPDAEAFISRIANKLAAVSRPIKFSTSIGAVYLEEELPITHALALADKTLYDVKRSETSQFKLV